MRYSFAGLLASVSMLAIPVVAHSQDREAAPMSDADIAADRIVVRAGGLDRLDMLASTSVVDDSELERNLDGQVGEVLTKLPGVSATGFAPGASRPVLRGFQGERIRVLTDGIGSIDASGTSADHAVAINPLLAERVEVLRGPAVLLFGSSAIGGAVNVIDRRIPVTYPEGNYRVDLLTSGDTAYDLREVAGSVDVGVANRVVFHVDGSYRETDDFEIPGFAASDELRADLLADAALEEDEGEFEEAEELEEAANQRGFVPNSATETYTLGTGLSYISRDVNIGVSVGYYDTNYGIPGRPGAGHHHEEGEEGEDHEGEDHDDDHEGEEHGEEEGEENVTIDLERWRADLRGQIHISDTSFLHELVFRTGYSDYTHIEFEGAEVGTVFDVEGVEGRAELIQNQRRLGNGVWRGSFGVQFSDTDFVADGPEAFVPENTTSQFAAFVLQEAEFGPFEVEFGGRYEGTSVTNEETGQERDFDTWSAAMGWSYTVGRDARIGLNLSHAERAPSAEELFADGPHIATQQFEVGDATLAKEKANGIEAYVQAGSDGLNLRAAAFYTEFEDYIFLAETGLEEDELPLFQHSQEDARYLGFEAEAQVPLAAVAGGSLLADVRASYVDAELDTGENVPRIPPLNALAALQWQSDSVELRSELEWFDSQTSIAPFETVTDDFAHVNLSARWRPFANPRLTVLVQADNIFDTEGRRHASFTKDFVPLAGRNFKLTVRTKL